MRNHLPSKYEVKVIHVSKLVLEEKNQEYRNKNLYEKINICNEYCENGLEDLVNLINKEIKKTIRAKGGKPYVFVIRSLKRLFEWKMLHWTYGRSFYSIGIHTPKNHARNELDKIIEREKYECKDLNDLRNIFEKDEQQLEENEQGLQKVLPYCDYFINNNNGSTLTYELKRFIDVIFGKCFIPPTVEELGMNYAYTAAMRSVDQSRQVGTAILDNEGNILSTGTNGVPKYGGDIYHEWQSEDPNYKNKEELKDQIMESLGIKKDDKGKRNNLSKTRLNDLLEFSNSLHSEQHAISNAARLGRSIQGATLFVTTFPCHLCAKNIIGVGIDKVIYIHPYAKSLVTELNGDACSIDIEEKDKLYFKHFEGFSPYRFFELFTWSKREKEGKHLESVEKLKLGHVKRKSLKERMLNKNNSKKAKDIHEPDFNASKIDDF